MLNRRNLLAGLAALLIAPQVAEAQEERPRKPQRQRPRKQTQRQTKRRSFKLDPKFMPQTVSYSARYAPGTIVVEPRRRFLYLVTGRGTARRYGVGVGRAGLEFQGSAVVGAKKEWPSWRPTDEMIARQPEKYAKYADGMAGGPGNPLGARALYLFQGGYDTLYRIHGTTEPWTIGTAASNGCIRMVNEHVIDLYRRVPVGAKVVVL